MTHVPAAVCCLAASLACGLLAMMQFPAAGVAAAVFGAYLWVVLRVRSPRALRWIGAATVAVVGLLLALAIVNEWTYPVLMQG